MAEQQNTSAALKEQSAAQRAASVPSQESPVASTSADHTTSAAPQSPPSAGVSGAAALSAADDEAVATIEPDDNTQSSHEGYESGTDRGSSASTSLASSIRDYNFENKRRYHKFKEGRYVLPNDDYEQEREDMKHAMVVHVCNGSLHSAPLDHPQRILDLGTGTGIWAIDMGDEYPEAEITGVDLSPIQPGFVPPNVHFMVDDIEADWLYPDNSIDYIHLRHMAPSVKDWPTLLSRAMRALKPGGWIEFQDMLWNWDSDDDTRPPDFTPKKAFDYVGEALDKIGLDLRVAEKHAERMRDEGFVNIIEDKKKVPVGPWPKDPHQKSIGAYCRAVIYDGLHAITIGPYTRILGWAPAEVEVFLVQVRKDLMNDSIHAYHFYHSYSGQKPLQTD